MAKPIQCHQCGSADLKKLEENEYTCNYCHSRIVVEKPKLDLGSFVKTFKTEHLYQASQTTFAPDGKIIKKVSWIGCLVFAVIFFGILSSVIFSIVGSFSSSNPSLTAKDDNGDGWEISYTSQVFYANGSKGGIIWIFTEETYNYTSNRSVLTIFDPVTKKEVKREIVVPEHKSGDDAPSYWDLFNGGKIIGDTIFFTPKNNGLSGRNIYTGKVVVDNAYLKNLIGQEIASAQAYPSQKNNYLEIKDAEGNEFYYFPKQKHVIKSDDYRNRKTAKFSYKTYFYLAGDKDKKYILRINQEMADYENASYFGSMDLNEFKRDKSYYKKYRKIEAVDSIPINHGFFNAEILTWNDSSFVIKYYENILDNAPINFAKYELSGKEIWKVSPDKLTIFKTRKKDDDFDFQFVNNSVIIYLTSPQKMGCGINCNSGKVEWTFKREK